MLILGPFLSKMKKNIFFLKVKEKFALQSALTFFLGGSEKKIGAILHFFCGTPWGPNPKPQNFASCKNGILYAQLNFFLFTPSLKSDFLTWGKKLHFFILTFP